MSPAKCPICKQPMAVDYRPFCSRRCADADLEKWLTGTYAIPTVEDDQSLQDGMGNDDED